jgi:hypothetical protein
MGISMPVKAEVLVVDKPSTREVSLDDVYDDDVYVAAPPAGSEEKEATAVPRLATRPATPPPEENYDDLLGELGGDPVSTAK